MIKYKCYKEVFNMARKEINEERRKQIQEFIKNNKLKTVGDIQEAIKDLLKDTI